MRPVAIFAPELHVGDVVLSGPTPHLIAEIVPYEHPTVPGCIGLARAADGYEITLWPSVVLEVVR